MVAGHLRSLYGFFNLFSNNQSQTLLMVVKFEFIKAQILKKNYHTRLPYGF